MMITSDPLHGSVDKYKHHVSFYPPATPRFLTCLASCGSDASSCMRPWSMVHPSCGCRKRKTLSLPCFPLVDLPLFSRRIMGWNATGRGKRLRDRSREHNSENILFFREIHEISSNADAKLYHWHIQMDLCCQGQCDNYTMNE